MDLTSVIYGPIVTEKGERLKAGQRTYTLKIAPTATKVDVKNALKKFYDVEVSSVRVIKVWPKTRLFGKGVLMEKRHGYKKALVTLSKNSKALDLSAFHVHSS
jgi:large subunit ribosomal protein L23